MHLIYNHKKIDIPLSKKGSLPKMSSLEKPLFPPYVWHIY